LKIISLSPTLLWISGEHGGGENGTFPYVPIFGCTAQSPPYLGVTGKISEKLATPYPQKGVFIHSFLLLIHTDRDYGNLRAKK
jgi:hypothetical protein